MNTAVRRRVLNAWWGLAAVGLQAGLGATQAQAQTVGSFLDSPIPPAANRGRNVSVTDRERPEYDPQGVNLGGFVLYPQVEAGVGYTDNVFNATSNKRSDAYFIIDPEFRLESRWANHQLRIASGFELRRFADEPLRNQSGFYSRADGRYDISRDTFITGAAQVRRAYQSQFSSAVPDNAIQPAEFVQSTAILRGQTRMGRWRLTGAVDFNDLNFKDIVVANGGRLDQDFRDRTVTRGAARVEYAVTPDASAFGEINGSLIDHRINTIGRLPNRDGDEIRALGGINFDLSALIRAQVAVGYIRRRFDAGATYPTISGFAYDARVEYFLTSLTTVTFVAVRSIEEAVITTSPGYLSNTLDLRVDHELLRNLVLTAGAGYQSNTFRGLDRTDEITSVRGEGTFLFNPTLGVRLGARYLDRGSAGRARGQSFDETQVVATLILRR